MDTPPSVDFSCASVLSNDATANPAALCDFVSQCASETLIDYQMLYVCYCNGSMSSRAAGLIFMLVIILPFWLVLLSDIADGFVSPIMGLLSQSIPFLSPRLAGVTLLAIGNGAPDLSSNSAAIASGAVHLSAGALTGAAMFVQCIVGSEVIRLSEGVAISPGQIRDMVIYVVSVTGVLFFFILGQFDFTFVAFAVLIYSLFVLNVALGVSSVFFFPALWSWGKHRATEQDELTALLTEGGELEGGERVGRAGTVRFNWETYRDQILKLQQEAIDNDEDLVDQEAAYPVLDNVPEEGDAQSEGDDPFASFTEEPDWAAVPSVPVPSSPPSSRHPPAGRNKANFSSALLPANQHKHVSFFHHRAPPISVAPPSSPDQPARSPAQGLRRNKTIGNRSEAVAPALSKLIDTRAYKMAVLADQASADPFHLENTVAPITNVTSDGDLLPMGPRAFLHTFSHLDTIGRARDLSGLGDLSGLTSLRRSGSLMRASSSRRQLSYSSSIMTRSRSMKSEEQGARSSSNNGRLALVPSLGSPTLQLDSPRTIKALPSRLSRSIALPQSPKASQAAPEVLKESPTDLHTSPLPSPLPPPTLVEEDPGILQQDETLLLISHLSACWETSLEVLENVLLEVTAGASEEWADGSPLTRIIRLFFLPLLLPCYLILRLTMPLLDPHSYRPQWLLLSIIGAPVAASYFLLPPLDGSLLGWTYVLLISSATGSVLSILAAFTITRNNNVPTLVVAGLDLAPTLFSLIAFLVGLLFVNLVAGEVVAILTLFAEVMHIPPSIVGCTLLAWGNSLSDLAGNTSLAVSGLSSMALTACTAGPLFNMMVSMALGFSSLLADGKLLPAADQVVKGDVTEEPGLIRVKLSADIVVACVFLVGFNLIQMSTVLMRPQGTLGGGLPKNFHIFARIWYLLYLVLAIAAAVGYLDNLFSL